jgi:hypothetical protein
MAEMYHLEKGEMWAPVWFRGMSITALTAVSCHTGVTCDIAISQHQSSTGHLASTLSMSEADWITSSRGISFWGTDPVRGTRIILPLNFPFTNLVFKCGRTGGDARTTLIDAIWCDSSQSA